MPWKFVYDLRFHEVLQTGITYIYIYIYIYCHPQTDLFRSIRTHQCG